MKIIIAGFPDGKPQISSIIGKAANQLSRTAKRVHNGSLRGKFISTLRIKLYPGGGVMDATVIKSSGNEIFDRSAINAVLRADPLPVPKNPAIFAKFKSFKLIFKPE